MLACCEQVRHLRQNLRTASADQGCAARCHDSRDLSSSRAGTVGHVGPDDQHHTRVTHEQPSPRVPPRQSLSQLRAEGRFVPSSATSDAVGSESSSSCTTAAPSSGDLDHGQCLLNRHGLTGLPVVAAGSTGRAPSGRAQAARHAFSALMIAAQSTASASTRSQV